MSSLGDALLLSSLLGNKKEKDIDPVRSVARLEKLLKKLKGEGAKDEKKKEEFGGLTKAQWTWLLFFSIPLLSVFNFWVLVEIMVSAVEKLHGIK